MPKSKTSAESIYKKGLLSVALLLSAIQLTACRHQDYRGVPQPLPENIQELAMSIYLFDGTDRGFMSKGDIRFAFGAEGVAMAAELLGQAGDEEEISCQANATLSSMEAERMTAILKQLSYQEVHSSTALNNTQQHIHRIQFAVASEDGDLTILETYPYNGNPELVMTTIPTDLYDLTVEILRSRLEGVTGCPTDWPRLLHHTP